MAQVIILGGGVAGMSAAHELVHRGIVVEVFERHHTCAGGKARNVDVPGTNLLHPDKYLPGEHGDAVNTAACMQQDGTRTGSIYRELRTSG